LTDAQIVKIVVGILAGSWPLIVGYRTKHPVLGVVGFFLALTGGLVDGFLLAAPTSYLCGWFIETRKKPGDDAVVSETTDIEPPTEPEE
jgi:hypothetical protein